MFIQEYWKIVRQQEKLRKISLKSHADSEKGYASFLEKANPANKIKMEALDKLCGLYQLPTKPFKSPNPEETRSLTPQTKKEIAEMTVDELKYTLLEKIQQEKGG